MAKKKEEANSEDPLDKFPITPLVETLGTKTNLPSEWDYKEEIANILMEKYNSLK